MAKYAQESLAQVSLQVFESHLPVARRRLGLDRAIARLNRELGKERKVGRWIELSPLPEVERERARLSKTRPQQRLKNNYSFSRRNAFHSHGLESIVEIEPCRNA